jgi:5-formyltetrahydrofolate cyclo-ligase
MSQSSPNPKSELRRQVRAAMATLDAETRHDASVRACARLGELDEFNHASVVMLYMPLASEIDVTPLALRAFQQNKTVCVPRMDWQRDAIVPVDVTSFDDRVMDVDEHGIRVPKHGRTISPSMIDLVVVPGVAFDALGNRLGRGGGHYDRFLAKLKPAATKIGIAFDAQIVDAVMTFHHDVPMDIVVTDRRVTHGNSARSPR